MNHFTPEQIEGVILAHTIPHICAGDEVSETRRIEPVGIDEDGVVSDLIVDIKVMKKQPIDHIKISFNV